MPERVLLIDTDMLVLLGGSGTLRATLDLLGFEAGQARRLPAAPYQMARGRLFKDSYAAPVLQAALRAADTIAPLSEQPSDPDVLDRLASESGIDPGEAVLFALLSEHEGCFLTTGDNRALETLATQGNVAEVRKRVAGRIICLESVLKLLVARNGARTTATAFGALRTHRTVAVLLSEAQARSDAVCLAGIDSYLDDLVRRTGEGFLYLP